MATYTKTSQPAPNKGAHQAQASSVESASFIDVVRLMGRPATKFFIPLVNGDDITITVNGHKRMKAPSVSGVVDAEKLTTSSMPREGYFDNSTNLFVKGANNTADVWTNMETGQGIEISIAPTSAYTYNSYDDFDNLIIENMTLTVNGGSTNTDFDITFV